MADFIHTCFSGPNLPATVLLLLAALYWFLVILGALGPDLFDIDLDMDMESDIDSAFSVGLVGLKFLNIGKVPIMLWISAFALSVWVFSLLFDKPAYHQDYWLAAMIVARNMAVGLVAAKIMTQPLRGKFEPIEPNKARNLIGRSVTTTTEVTPRSGQAECPAEAAPLRLNVRSAQGILAKGEEAVIVGFDSRRNVFTIQRESKKILHEVS